MYVVLTFPRGLGRTRRRPSPPCRGWCTCPRQTASSTGRGPGHTRNYIHTYIHTYTYT